MINKIKNSLATLFMFSKLRTFCMTYGRKVPNSIKKALLFFAMAIISFFMRAIARIPKKSCRIYALKYLAEHSYKKGHLEKARAQAFELLELAPEFQDGCLNGNAIHDSNIILGKVCLREGNVEAAKEHLLKAAHTPGSPQLNSFGPNMALANELLSLGEQEVIIEYFKLCGKFWKSGKLFEWAEVIKAGGTPNFRGNLNY